MSTEDSEISYWVEFVGEQKVSIVRYSKHDWATILRNIADAYEEQHKTDINEKKNT